MNPELDWKADLAKAQTECAALELLARSRYQAEKATQDAIITLRRLDPSRMSHRQRRVVLAACKGFSRGATPLQVV